MYFKGIIFTAVVIISSINCMSISDSLKSSNMHTIIVTDMEPDDSAAIIACKLSGILPEYVYIIDRSNEDDWNRLNSFEQLSPLIGMQSIPYKYDKADQIANSISDYISKHNVKESDEFMIICLANFMPLYDLAKKLDITKFKVTVAAYGSVNMRWTLKAFDKQFKGDKASYDAKKVEFFELINTGYKAFYLFETFGAFGQKNAVDNHVTPELMELLKTSSSPVIKFLNNQINGWNDCIMKSEIKDLNATDQYKLLSLDNLDYYAEQLKKSAEDMNFSDRLSAKIVYAIWECRNQFVFADIGLMISILEPEFNALFERKHVDIPDRFLVTSDSNKSDTALYFINKEENKTELLQKFAKCMIDIYKKLD